MQKKRSVIVVLGIWMMLFLSGCNMYYKMDTNIKADGSGKIVTTIGDSEEGLQEDIKEGIMTQQEVEEYKKKTKKVVADGKIYYCTTEIDGFSSGKKLENILISKGYTLAAHASGDTFFVMNYPQEKDKKEESTDSVYMEICVTFEKAITRHKGGSLSNDNKTITWDYEYLMSGKDLYATTSVKKAKPLSFNVKKGKIYTKHRVINVRSGKGTVYLDEKRVVPGKTKTRDGMNTLIIMNQNGTKKIMSFVVDTTAPLVFGAEDNGVYKKKVTLDIIEPESDIKSVYINKKKIPVKEVTQRNGYTIKKKGTYKVKVVNTANQKKIITFTIK